MYTVSRTTTGVEAKIPAKLGFAVRRKRQRTWSFDALRESIDPVPARVPSRSAAGSGQSEDAPLPPPQLVKSSATAATATTCAAARLTVSSP
jgi:hypothetical protein